MIFNFKIKKTKRFLFQIGLAIDGFSGGGGAVIIKMLLSHIEFKINTLHMPKILLNKTIGYFQMNNGQFFGQFAGKFIASLSAVIK